MGPSIVQEYIIPISMTEAQNRYVPKLQSGRDPYASYTLGEVKEILNNRKVLVLITRHSECGGDGITGGGGLDPHLTEKGKKDSIELARIIQKLVHGLEIKVGIRSDRIRTAETEQLAFANTEVEFLINPNVTEIHHGASEQMDDKLREKKFLAYLQAKKEEYPDGEFPEDLSWQHHFLDAEECQGHETFYGLYNRVSIATFEEAAKHPGQAISIVAHSGVCRCMIYVWLRVMGLLEKDPKTQLLPMHFQGYPKVENCDTIALLIDDDNQTYDVLGVIPFEETKKALEEGQEIKVLSVFEIIKKQKDV